jgi:hypothetical protein
MGFVFSTLLILLKTLAVLYTASKGKIMLNTQCLQYQQASKRISTWPKTASLFLANLKENKTNLQSLLVWLTVWGHQLDMPVISQQTAKLLSK